MNEIIKKRAELANYFFNNNETYDKTLILNKEFAVLSFSPKEEYIDNVTTTFDHILSDFDDIRLSNSSDDFYIKGIVVDIDHKKDYSILHIQNKSDQLSVNMGSNLVYKYGNDLVKGQVLFIKGHYYGEKFYMHFMIDLLNQENYRKEKKYIQGMSLNELKQKDMNIVDKNNDYGLINQATYFKSQNGNRCIRINLFSARENDEAVRIICQNKYNDLPYNILNAGDMIFYEMSNGSDVFCNKITVVN